MVKKNSKIITDDIIKQDGSCVLCYGHFNIIHPGHLRFLEFASKHGTLLKVFLQNDKHLNSSEKKYFFNQTDRANALASLELIDQVIIQKKLDLIEIIDILKPQFLILGKEHENKGPLNTALIRQKMTSIKGKVVFHSGTTQYSNSELKMNQDSNQNQVFALACRRRGIDEIKLKKLITKFDKASLLVLGDTIVDQYIACDPLGMSSEAPVIVVKELESEEYLGGAGIVAAHLSALGANTKFISVVGDDTYSKLAENKLIKHNISHDLFIDESRPTTFKIRYLVDNQKIFRVSKLKEHNLSKEIEDKVIEKLYEVATKISSILICDFVYGVITPRILSEISNIVKKYNLLVFGDLQCSSQVGNISKFQNFNLICPTEREARIGINNKDDSVEQVSNKILDITQSRNLIMKLGANGFITYEKTKYNFIDKEHFPALTKNPLDVAGAGDSLLAGVALSLTCGSDIMTASAIGAYMASLAVQSIGNKSVDKKTLIEYIERNFS